MNQSTSKQMRDFFFTIEINMLKAEYIKYEEQKLKTGSDDKKQEEYLMNKSIEVMQRYGKQLSKQEINTYEKDLKKRCNVSFKEVLKQPV